MEFSNHCHIRAMSREDSYLSSLDKFQSLLSPQFWHGGMVVTISKFISLIANVISAHHHHSKTTPASRRVPVFSQWFLDRNATYASFSFHLDIQDLFETSCLTDRLSTNTSGFFGNAFHPAALISNVISHYDGTSLFFTEEVSECHSVSHDVLFSAVCISDNRDRAILYPIIGYILFDIPSEESLTKTLLHMTGKDDSGQIQSDDASCDESAQLSRNGGLVATATSPEKGMFYFLQIK